ncbi:hypothetical protein [Halohasta litorea]|uniref:Uncharacterized protein n=1 Tax=Halohasta litorea TaxID=869891 RepID=A0ABD6D9C4_9EURY|nr:hypothetical protein [Halohasta litorea]
MGYYGPFVLGGLAAAAVGALAGCSETMGDAEPTDGSDQTTMERGNSISRRQTSSAWW